MTWWWSTGSVAWSPSRWGLDWIRPTLYNQGATLHSSTVQDSNSRTFETCAPNKPDILHILSSRSTRVICFVNGQHARNQGRVTNMCACVQLLHAAKNDFLAECFMTILAWDLIRLPHMPSSNKVFSSYVKWFKKCLRIVRCLQYGTLLWNPRSTHAELQIRPNTMDQLHVRSILAPSQFLHSLVAGQIPGWRGLPARTVLLPLLIVAESLDFVVILWAPVAGKLAYPTNMETRRSQLKVSL